MKIQWEGNEYDFDMSGIRRRHFATIKQALGIGSVKALTDGMAELDIDALSAIVWFIKTERGEKFDIGAEDFDVFGFIAALNRAIEAENSDDADPTDEVDSTPEPAPTSTTSETSTSSDSPTSVT